MPKGFIGAAPMVYLQAVEDLLEESTAVHNANAMGISARNEKAPYTVEDAKTGTYATGTGSGTNIVVDEHVYNRVIQQTTKDDDHISQQFYDVIQVMKDLLTTSYKLPRASKKLNAISTS